MEKLEDLINKAVKAALKANIVPEKEETSIKENKKEEEEDEDVCDECGGDLILVEEHRAVCEKCGVAYEI